MSIALTAAASRWRYSLRSYATVFRLGLQDSFEYRFNLLIRIFLGFLPLAVVYILWSSIYHSMTPVLPGSISTATTAPTIRGYDFPSMITYYVVAEILFFLVDTIRVEWEISRDIRQGEINKYLLRPLNLFCYRLTLLCAFKVVFLAAMLLPATAVLWLLRPHLILSLDPLPLLATLAAVSLAFLLNYLMSYLLGLLTFWMMEIHSILIIKGMIATFLTGGMIPLDLLPLPLQPIITAIPFTYVIFFPAALYLGHLRGPAIWQGFALQVGWILLLALLTRLAWRRGLRRYGAFGG